MARSAIAHSVGNRDDVIDAAASRSVGRIGARFDAALRATPPEDRVDHFIELVFSRDRQERRAVLDLNDALTQRIEGRPGGVAARRSNDRSSAL